MSICPGGSENYCLGFFDYVVATGIRLKDCVIELSVE